MDLSLTYKISNEDTASILKTILAFLKALDFSATSDVLQGECSSRGYFDITGSSEKVSQSHKCDQTEFPDDRRKLCVLETSVHEETNDEINSNTNPLYVYYADVSDISHRHLTGDPQHFSDNGNVYYAYEEPSGGSKEYVVEKIIQQQSEQQNLSPNNSTTRSEKKCPNSVETDMPSKTSSKQSLKQQVRNLRKTRSNSSLERYSSTKHKEAKSEISRYNKNCDCRHKNDCKELREKFRQLQNEHQKLMGVTAELTMALQTHILGQSENLNAMLNNCKVIYPDLFNSPNKQNDYNIERNSLKNSLLQLRSSGESDRRESSSPDVVEIFKENSTTKSVQSDFNDVPSTSNDNLKQAIASTGSSLNSSPSSIKTVRYSSTKAGSETIVEIKGMTSSPINSTVVVTSKLRRPQSSSVILVTASEPQQSNSNPLLRQQSSKSCDERLIANNQAGASAKEANLKETSTDINDVEQVTLLHVENYAREVENEDTPTFGRKADLKTPPEVFITTENMEKANQKHAHAPTESGWNYLQSQYFELDFKKLKRDMLKGDDELKLRLLQALRWRITRADPETQDQVLNSYIRHDLLGLHSNLNPHGQSTIEMYYCPNKENSIFLQESMTRLMSTFASLTLGRDYLCQDDDLLVSLLVPLMTGNHHSKAKIDANTRSMLMATLQKLSIRQRQRLKMISAGLVEYVVSFLATYHSTASEYCMEYTTALLMNLCLHHEARERLRVYASDVVSLLADLLDSKNQNYMPYINGAMYSLLKDPEISREAKRLNFGELLACHIKRTEGEARRQLQFILKLYTEGGEDCDCDPCIEPDIELDLLEPELDKNDLVASHPSGEELLKDYKLLFPVYGTQVYAAQRKCLCRPVTPFPKSGAVESSKMDNANVNTKILEEKEVSTENLNKNVSFGVDDPYNTQTPEDSTDQKQFERPSKKTGVSQSSFRLNSFDMSYCEQTKQFYRIPSKRAIFEPESTKSLYKNQPSFMKAAGTASKSPNASPIGFRCRQPYSRSNPNASHEKPIRAPKCPNSFTTCYRESYVNHYSTHYNNSCQCRKCNKYSCNCYNVIKGSLDGTANNQKSMHKKPSNKSGPEKFTCNCQKRISKDNRSTGCKYHDKLFSQPTTSVNQTDEVVHFTYEELLSTTSDRCEHDSPTMEKSCQCYENVFQSRPKILRTPP